MVKGKQMDFDKLTKLAFKYMNTILEDWHNKKYKTINDVELFLQGKQKELVKILKEKMQKESIKIILSTIDPQKEKEECWNVYSLITNIEVLVNLHFQEFVHYILNIKWTVLLILGLLLD